MYKSKEQVLLEAVIKLMENKSLWETSATELAKILRKNAGDYAYKIPQTENLLSRKLAMNKDALIDYGIVMTRHHSGTRTIRFTKTTLNEISTKTAEKENVMETKTYKKSLKSEIIEAIKELGPITSSDIAEVTISKLGSTRATINKLIREECSIKHTGGNLKDRKYYWDNTPKEVVENKVPKPVKHTIEPKVIPKEDKCVKTEISKTDVNTLNRLVDRAYYLMLALEKLNTDLLMDHLDLSDVVADEVLLKMLSKYKNNTRADITVRPIG